MLQDKKRTKPARARIDFQSTFVPWSSTTTYAYAFMTDSPTLILWRKQNPVFEQKVNLVFVTAEELFIFSLPHFKLKKKQETVTQT